MSQRKENVVRIAVQKKGKLRDDSLALLRKIGLEFDFDSKSRKDFSAVKGMPVEIVFIRDDDIPKFVSSGAFDLGIVGENVLQEKRLGDGSSFAARKLFSLGFAPCRLFLAASFNVATKLEDLNGKKIATEYPRTLQKFFNERSIDAEIVEMSGSVEIAPKCGIADAICDLVSSGATLKENGLEKIQEVFASEAVLIESPKVTSGLVSDIAMRVKEVLDLDAPARTTASAHLAKVAFV